MRRDVNGESPSPIRYKAGRIGLHAWGRSLTQIPRFQSPLRRKHVPEESVQGHH
jgi:hypothetical protein